MMLRRVGTSWPSGRLVAEPAARRSAGMLDDEHRMMRARRVSSSGTPS